ncbi:peptide chain release factor N(5)-glutamine methyltransferase [filamentous cyanobacterium LEGE 11480]|uniref:Release factor glutamine methyltransferase n=1 Tax=Romeriopsis navalis LEGE 11480 TaxID=2777977 RepID=A0A928VI00_9CYAN|nr:peptide chain release factor N(5)-glutamine methyltransferase [Romeriopsis navalis]MBE9028963.1 peptide chain release factor N(5)-glutamine methyltransferase [Romeriopsis navalis LEGE 11480]
MFTVSGTELWKWRSRAQAAAVAISIDQFEVDWLLLELSQIDRLTLRLETYKTQPDIRLKLPFEQLQTLWEQRLNQRIPVQYLVGYTHWREFTLKVSPAVLIPRPETELMIDLVLEAVERQPDLANGPWVDLGTGSGAIAIGLAAALPEAQIHAVDLSPKALAIAQANAQTCGLAERITFHAGRWFEPIAHLRGEVRGLISNPPYIPTATIATLQPEVQKHEPHLALDGGADGLKDIRHLVREGSNFLQPQGLWLVEMMAGQGTQVSQLLQQAHYQPIRIVNDLAGRDRFCLAYCA